MTDNMIPQGTTVRWFRQDHEHRNYWLRFGLLRLARSRRLKYEERPWSDRTLYGFEDAPTAEPQKANSLIVVEADGLRRRCVVESNDSFFVMSNLVEHCDVYFCAGYNSGFFRERCAPSPLEWQREEEYAFYQARAHELIQEYGTSFDRVVPFIPIAPDLHRRTPLSFWRQKIRNIKYRLETKLSRSSLPLSGVLADFEDRYVSLINLRNDACRHDVVLLDTLWGWPRHRIELHKRLRGLSPNFDIHSRLAWHEPSSWDGSDLSPLDSLGFPMLNGGPIERYEEMLAQSRLAPFATGFHYGWRNIMALALMIGTPVLSDKIILEPWFGLDRFRIFFNDDNDWSCLEPLLSSLTNVERRAIAHHNSGVFDEFMSPEATARYFVSTALNHGSIS